MDLSLFEYAEDGLVQLKSLVSPAEFIVLADELKKEKLKRKNIGFN